MSSRGVMEYKFFMELPEDYIPSLPDAAMALYESHGREQCVIFGFTVDASCAVILLDEPDNSFLGRSKLAQGKFIKDLSISLWLEDVGTLGFSVSQLREEMDTALWSGWFRDNVDNRIDMELIRKNREKEKNDIPGMTLKNIKVEYPDLSEIISDK